LSPRSSLVTTWKLPLDDQDAQVEIQLLGRYALKLVRGQSRAKVRGEHSVTYQRSQGMHCSVEPGRAANDTS
jgi:hypothetical protein